MNEQVLCSEIEEDIKNGSGYAILSERFVATAFESSDVSSNNTILSQQAAEALNHDASYRIREVINTACQLMRHAGRCRLLHGDIERALTFHLAPPLYGHNSGVRTARSGRTLADHATASATSSSCIWVPEETLCDLYKMCSQNAHTQTARISPHLSAQWLLVDGRRCGSLTTDEVKVKLERQSSCSPAGQMSPCQATYYTQIVHALFGNNNQLLRVALWELRRSALVQGGVLAHMLRCLLYAVQRLAGRPWAMLRALLALQSLTSNVHVNLGCRPNLNHVASALVFCVIEDQPKQPDSRVPAATLKPLACLLLAQLVHKWTTGINQLPQQVCRTLADTVRDRKKSLRQQCGAIIALTYIGPNALLRYLCPVLSDYCSALYAVLSTNRLEMSTRLDAMSVQAALAHAISRILQHCCCQWTRHRCSIVSGGVSGDGVNCWWRGPSPAGLYAQLTALCDQAHPPPLPSLALPQLPSAPVVCSSTDVAAGWAAKLWPAGCRAMTRAATLRRHHTARPAVSASEHHRAFSPPLALLSCRARVHFQFRVIGARTLPLRRAKLPRLPLDGGVLPSSVCHGVVCIGSLRKWPAGGARCSAAGLLSVAL